MPTVINRLTHAYGQLPDERRAGILFGLWLAALVTAITLAATVFRPTFLAWFDTIRDVFARVIETLTFVT